MAYKHNTEKLDEYQRDAIKILEGLKSGEEIETSDIATKMELPTAATNSVLSSLERIGKVKSGHKMVEGPKTWKLTK